jgi:hypothetical protein
MESQKINFNLFWAPKRATPGFAIAAVSAEEAENQALRVSGAHL